MPGETDERLSYETNTEKDELFHFQVQKAHSSSAASENLYHNHLSYK